jgi:hypothetical protein
VTEPGERAAAEQRGLEGHDTRSSPDLDALAVSGRFLLFNFTRRDDHVAYLWVLRALDWLRAVHQVQAHTDDVARAEHDKATTAGAALRAARQSLAEAVAAAHEQAAGFGELARPDLRSLIGVGASGALPHWPDAAVSSLLVLWDGAALIDASAGFWDNEALATELLGFRPTRHAPLGSGSTLGFGDSIGEAEDDDDDAAV